MAFVMPAFDRHPEEAAVIGRLLAGYGDLELTMCHAVAMVNGGLDTAVRRVFEKRGERGRIQRALALGAASYERCGLKQKFEQAISAMDVCLNIRNQYAHCVWADGPGKGLAFVNLEETALKPDKIDFHDPTYHWVDVPLLQSQLHYFEYTQELLLYLNYEGRVRNKRIKFSPFTSPPVKVHKPRMHN